MKMAWLDLQLFSRLLLFFLCSTLVPLYIVDMVKTASAQTATLEAPPIAPVRPVTEDYFGTKVVDLYRYMENLKDPEVAAWMKAQNDYTRAVLNRIPGRKALLARIKEIGQAAPATVSDVWRLSGGRYFYLKRLASEDVPNLYMREGLIGREVLLVNPGKLSDFGNSPSSIDYFYPSENGRYTAYGVSSGGAAHSVLHVLDTATGRETGKKIDRADFSVIAWRPDDQSFFYTRYPRLAEDAPPGERYQKGRVYLHVLGTDPENDPAVFGYGVSPAVLMGWADTVYVVTVPDSPYAFGVVHPGNETKLYVAPLESVLDSKAPWRKVCDVEDRVTAFAVHGDELYLLTRKGTPRYKVVRTSLSKPDLARAEVVVPSSEAVITGLAAAQDGLYVQELEAGIGRLLRIPFPSATGHRPLLSRNRGVLWRPAGQPERVPLPVGGAISLPGPFGGKYFVTAAHPRLPGFLFELTSWTKARRIYAYDPETKQVTDTDLQPAGAFDNPPGIESVEVKARSYGGTMVPLSIIYKRELKLDGSNPTLLMAYGSWGLTFDARYIEREFLAWLERGGVLAVAHVRGGGEYGEEWHQAGMKLNKRNTIRDFIACAKYLIENNYTAPSRLAGEGSSAGGPTIGGAITERPDLLSAALDESGFCDMVRYKFPPNEPEFGNVDTPEGFKALYAMSPYHHAKDGTPYPAVMLTTGINDPVLDPWHAAKMAARLQAATSSGKPILLRVDYEAGHGPSAEGQLWELLADEMSFLFWQFGLPEFQPPAQAFSHPSRSIQ